MSISGTKILALKSDGSGYDPLKLDSTGKLRVIAEATSISAAAINLNTDTLETLQTNIFNKFDNVVGAINNTGAIGEGSDILKSMSLGYDRANGVGRSILVDSLGHIQTDIVSGTITLPSGASTEAKQDTIIGHVDGVETSLTAITGYVDGIEALIGTTNSILATIDADTGAIKTAVELLDNAISGSELQVDIVASLPAGSNNIGDVDVLSLPALPTGSNTIGTVNLSATDNAVLDTIDAVLDTIDGKITACNTGAVVVSSGAITATLSATDNAVLDTIDAVLDTIKVDTEAIETAVEALAGGGTTGEWLASASLADTTYSAAFDASAYKDVRFMGVASATIGMTGMPLMGSQTSGGTYYALQASEKITETQTSIGGVTKYMLSAVVENTPKFLKIYNNTGGSKTFELDYVGYVN